MRRSGYLIWPRLPHWLPHFLGWGNRLSPGDENIFSLLVTWLPHFQRSTITRAPVVSRAPDVVRARMCELRKKTGNRVTTLKTLHVSSRNEVTNQVTDQVTGLIKGRIA
jgi:hypothetical protein